MSYISPTVVRQLYFAEGNVFDTVGFGFDGICCFLPHGLNCINADYIRFCDAAPQVVAVVYDYRNRQQPPLTLGQIDTAVCRALDMLVSRGCRRIGFHGVKVYGVSDAVAEEHTVSAVVRWLGRNGNRVDRITLVDRLDSYNAHLGATYHIK